MVRIELTTPCYQDRVATLVSHPEILGVRTVLTRLLLIHSQAHHLNASNTMCPQYMNSTKCALLIHNFISRWGRFVRTVGFEPTEDTTFVPSLVSKTSSINLSLTSCLSG